jgi:hypothetical protein
MARARLSGAELSAAAEKQPNFSRHHAMIVAHFLKDENHSNTSIRSLDGCVNKTLAATHGVEVELLRRQPRQVRVLDEPATLRTWSGMNRKYVSLANIRVKLTSQGLFFYCFLVV